MPELKSGHVAKALGVLGLVFTSLWFSSIAHASSACELCRTQYVCFLGFCMPWTECISVEESLCRPSVGGPNNP